MAFYKMSSLPQRWIRCIRPPAALAQPFARFVKNRLTSLRENNNDMRVYGSLSV
jgi:hypothetical protein